MAPAALSILTTTFRTTRQSGPKAFGAYGAVSAVEWRSACWPAEP